MSLREHVFDLQDKVVGATGFIVGFLATDFPALFEPQFSVCVAALFTNYKPVCTNSDLGSGTKASIVGIGVNRASKRTGIA